MSISLRHLSVRPRLPQATLAPVVALATTLVVSGLGIRGLVVGTDALHSALQSADSAQELKTVAGGVQRINGDLYRVLTLTGAQIKGHGAAAELHPLLVESDAVATMLRAWRDRRATPAQRPRVTALIAAVERYRGAVDFVSQMLDVDFVAAVSFIRPFDRNFHDLMQTLDALVAEVQARQRADADAALDQAQTTKRVFEGVGTASVLLALLAAANMGWTAARSNRLSRQNTMLMQMTQIDPLTSLGNRRHFDATLATAWTACTARQDPLTLIMFDIDHFKKFNDSQGHQAGDGCLQQVAAAVMSCSRDQKDFASRYGGEEFAIVLPATSLDAGRAVAERVRQAIVACAIPHPAAGPPGIVTVSLGVGSLVPRATGAPTTLIEAADKALYAAKKGGRNQVMAGEPVAEAMA